MITLRTRLRAGHNPFNTPESYRNKSDAGVIGEAILELDDIVGTILDTLKELNIDDDTLIVRDVNVCLIGKLPHILQERKVLKWLPMSFVYPLFSYNIAIRNFCICQHSALM